MNSQIEDPCKLGGYGTKFTKGMNNYLIFTLPIMLQSLPLNPINQLILNLFPLIILNSLVTRILKSSNSWFQIAILLLVADGSGRPCAFIHHSFFLRVLRSHSAEEEGWKVELWLGRKQ